MNKFFCGIIAISLWTVTVARAQERPTLQVNAVKTGTEVAWPYDAKQLQSQLAAELQNKQGKKFAVVTEPPSTGDRLFVLDCEILEWRPGNAAKRILVGMGSGRESAKIRYSVTNAAGKKIFEHQDTIRAEFWGNAYASSVGQLAHPLADKIAGHLGDAKLE
jgi:Domain of unknown function (DUF4410)